MCADEVALFWPWCVDLKNPKLVLCQMGDPHRCKLLQKIQVHNPVTIIMPVSFKSRRLLFPRFPPSLYLHGAPPPPFPLHVRRLPIEDYGLPKS